MQCFYVTEISILFLSTFWFFLFNGDDFNEYVEAFYYVIHSIFLLSWYYTYYLQRRLYVQFMVELESIIELSKKLLFIFIFHFFTFVNFSTGCQDLSSEALFKDIDNQFYSISKRMYYLLAKIQAPCYMFPVVFVSIFKFISSNHDKSSFQQHFRRNVSSNQSTVIETTLYRKEYNLKSKTKNKQWREKLELISNGSVSINGFLNVNTGFPLIGEPHMDTLYALWHKCWLQSLA